jgi:hypothetical protein
MTKKKPLAASSCPYCSKPKLLDVDFSGLPESERTGLGARGHFLKRIKNPHYPAWPVKFTYRQKGNQHSKLLEGQKHFGKKWIQLDVEILGLFFTEKPPMPPVPLFGITNKYSLPKKKENTTHILWNACRIKDKRFDFIVKLHWWPTHERIFTVERFSFDGADEAAALMNALSIFGRGRGRKPTEYFTSNKHFLTNLNAAVLESHARGRFPSEMEIAIELFPEAKDNSRELRKWLQTSWRKWHWKDIVKAIVDDDTEDNGLE